MRVILGFLHPVAPDAESFTAHLRSCSHGKSYPLVGLSSDDGKICVHILRYTARILRLSRICRAKVSSVPPSLSRATLAFRCNPSHVQPASRRGCDRPGPSGDFEEDRSMAQDRKGRGRGFASMNPEKQREIASKGGRAAHNQGTAHEWSSEEARAAGRKGGAASRHRMSAD